MMLGLLLSLLSSLLLTGPTADAAEIACDGSQIHFEQLRSTDAPTPASPPSPEHPVIVEIKLQITEFSDIDPVKSTFRFEGYGDFRWCDPRSAFDAEAAGQDVQRYLGISRDDPTWNLGLSIANGVGAVEVTQRMIEIHSDGYIRMTGYFNSVVSAPFDLRLFPFDRQALEIQIESVTYNGKAIQLRTNDDRVSFAPNVFLQEWRIEGIRGRFDQTVNVRDHIPFSRAVITLLITREWGYYVFKIWVPLFLIVALSWSIFWMHDESMAGRIRISATAFLTIVAYQFAISGSLPKIAYLTLMDRLMVASFVLIAMSALQSMLVTTLRDIAPERGAALDRMSRWIFPLAYASFITGILTMYLR